MTQPTVARHTDADLLECPVLTGSARSEFLAAARAANRFGDAVVRFVGDRPPTEKVAWLKTTVRSSRVLFQPWNMELLFVLSSLGRARFNELVELLGLSTRTLSDKLKALREAGFIDREVFDEHPVRIEYVPTQHGRRTAALATPLVAHLNQEALRAAGRIP